MIPLEGNILPGLDEFMLRFGHLKVLCEVADEVGRSWRRIDLETSRRLTALCPIDDAESKDLTEYLFVKRLCPIGAERDAVDSSHVRYPDIFLDPVQGDRFVIRTAGSQQQPAVWWQDLCLADSRVRSKVGAITIDAKAGSKTGLSHISDWATLLDLISNVGELSFVAKLIARLPTTLSTVPRSQNPYILGGEKILLAYASLAEDFDIFSRFLTRLAESDWPIKKSKAREIFASVIDTVATEAEAASLPSTSRYKLFEQARELNKAARRSKRPAGNTSTAWHRASSRLETYVDLGFLSKDKGNPREKFEYTYYPGDTFERAISTLRIAESSQEWLEKYLVSCLYGTDANALPMSRDELAPLVIPVLNALKLPTTVCSISVLAQGIAWQKAEQDAPVSIAAVRACLEELARMHPECARLSRGHRGTRAEFISIEPSWLRSFHQSAN